MKIFSAIVFVTISSPWFVGGAPPQVEPSKDSRGGKNVTLVEQRGQEQAEVSLATKSTPGSAGSLGTEELQKNLPGINPVEDHGNNNTSPILHPITDTDLQTQLNELRSHPEEEEVNRKEDVQPGDFIGTPENNVHLQTITLDKEYTPQEIAEFIFWTGDERGVAMAISDLLNDGLMISHDDVIKFLEDVKSELDYLKTRYEMSLSHLEPSPTPLVLSLLKKNPFFRPESQDKITSSYSKGPGASFDSKFRRLVQQAHNNREREQKDSGVTVDIRSLEERPIPPSFHFHPEKSRFGVSGAYDRNGIMIHPIPSKKNNRASGTLRYYFPQVPQPSRRSVGIGFEEPPSLGQGSGQGIWLDEYSSTNGYDRHNDYDNNNIQIRKNNNNNEEPDFSEIIQSRMEVADDRLRELSLQDIIYNLARELFSQNFKQRGSSPGILDPELYTFGKNVDYQDQNLHHPYLQKQLERVSRLIERNLISERTPKAIEKEVQNILFTAWVDSAKEQREIGTFERSMGNLGNKRDGRFRRQINPPLPSWSSRYL